MNGERNYWDQENVQHVIDYVVEGWKDLRVAPQRHQDLMRVHAEGWNKVAQAIYLGLGEIAKAIRDVSR